MKDKLSYYTPHITIFFILYGCSLMLYLDVSFDWAYTINFPFSSYKEWYPNFAIIPYTAFKITPFFLLLISLLLNIRLLFFFKLSFISIYDKLINKNKYLFISFLLAILLFISFQIDTNLYSFKHNLILIISIMFVVGNLFIFNSLPNSKLLLFFLIGITFILRLFYYLYAGPFDLGADSLARVSQVYTWQKYGGLPGGLNWPFAHHYQIFIVSKLLNVPFEVGGRLVSLIASILVIPFGYLLFKKLFNKTTAFYSLFFYAINPFFIKYSTIQMTEIPFLFFMILGIYYGFKFFEKSNFKFLLLSIIPLNIASLMRFEAWIIIPLFAIVFLLRYGDYRKVIKWFSFAIVSAFLFSLYSFIVSGNPISGVTASDIEVIEHLRGQTWIDSLKKLVAWPWIPIYFAPFFALAFLYTLLKGKNKYFSFFIFLLSSYYFFKMGQMTLMPFWRYLTFVIFCYLPILFYYIKAHVSERALFLMFVYGYVYYSAIDVENIYKSYHPPPKGLLESAKYVKNNFLEKDDLKIILSINPGNNDDLWLFKSEIFDDYWSFKRLHPGSQQNKFGELFTKENLVKNIVERDFNLILVQEGYEIDSVFEANEVIDYLSEKQIDTTDFGQHTLYYIN